MIISTASALNRHPGASLFRLSEAHETNAMLLRLVMSGRMTMRCDAVDNYTKRTEKLPSEGDLGIALFNHGLPALVIRTVSVSMIPFDEVTDDMIPEQGEYQNLEEWRSSKEEMLKNAELFEPKVMMLMERFELVEVF